MGSQLVDVPYLTSQFNLDQPPYQVPDPNSMASSIKSESFDNVMGGAFDDFELRADRSLSYSGASSQSLSPQPHKRSSLSLLPELSMNGDLFGPSSEQISPTTSISLSRKDSVDEDHRAERRRAQNRAAQRAYRQRKDQSLKQREKEVESLREELDKAQRLNRTLCKVVALLRERLKEPADPEEP
ncbi:uncharacterized protein HMPREF1541_00256 [Cyphellophora europaea CBS 101466]|uniref:BZIP domain-containing protein n=1 Tax=Cyphellophora europaea (strain CBS 101466) TaxID=1220924 RepID=W2SBJ0_CYPE1|nr:uncharacterized protein HMPREF1541_00256 [Cyphellophora europaea CBS 101466]ETN46072.1 hypothetical protein HMPREF1541_00256 [Cyphellophora europaea CBS 101466]